MKRMLLLFACFLCAATLQAQPKRFNIFNYEQPAGYNASENADRVLLEKVEGNTYCQLYLFAAVNSRSGAAQNFSNNWENYVNRPYRISKPAQRQEGEKNGWTIISGAANGTYQNTSFTTIVTTSTRNNTSFCIIATFNDMKYADEIAGFMEKVRPDASNSNASGGNNQQGNGNQPPAAGNTGQVAGITFSTTNFNDGWTARPGADFVRVSKAGTELRLFYVNDALDNARPNTVEPELYYWKKLVEPGFTVSNPEKWVGVTYPVIYFMQGDAVNRQTGQSCHVAIKVIYEGGARVVMAITPNRASMQQQFPHPNDLNRMLGYNKFAVAQQDLIGKWGKAGGGGVEYYNSYTGNYAGMSALSTTDEFSFTANGNYESVHNSANMNNGGTRFSALTYKGRYTVNNWEMMATNRVGGKTKKFWCQLEAVKNGFILVLTDSDYEPLKYVLFKKK